MFFEIIIKTDKSILFTCIDVSTSYVIITIKESKNKSISPFKYKWQYIF